MLARTCFSGPASMTAQDDMEHWHYAFAARKRVGWRGGPSPGRLILGLGRMLDAAPPLPLVGVTHHGFSCEALHLLGAEDGERAVAPGNFRAARDEEHQAHVGLSTMFVSGT